MIYEPPNTSTNFFNILAKVGVSLANWGSNSPIVNVENGFPNAPKYTRIYEQRNNMLKGIY